MHLTRTARTLGLAALALMITGCSDPESSSGDDVQRPKSVVHAQMAQSKPYKDVPVVRDMPTIFRTTDVLPDLDVRSLIYVGKQLYAGGATQVMRLDDKGTSFEKVADSPAGAGAVVDMAAQGTTLLVAYADRVLVIDGSAQPKSLGPVSGAKIRAVTADATHVYVGTDHGLATLSDGGLTALAGTPSVDVRDLVIVKKQLWAATKQGVARYDLDGSKSLASLGKDKLGAEDVRALQVSPDGALVAVGTSAGIARVHPDTDKVEVINPGLDSLPNGDVIAVDVRGDMVLSGHTIGATAMSSASKDHYHAMRWIADERVTAVALAEDGSRWLATSKGVTHVELKNSTLAERQVFDEPLNDKFWRMDGFVSCEGHWQDDWDHSAAPHLGDSDNDGLWTEMQVGAWCLAYATTKDEAYYKKARKAMDVMLMQVDVPALSFEAKGMKRGFITRSLVRSDEGDVFTSKSTQDNWHLQEYKGKKYYWKDDTSSDEYDGHFFGIPLFYDLCAKTEEEKQQIREHVDSVMSYVVDNNYLLIDLDGKPTTHGDWNGLANAVDGLGPCIQEGKDECFESYGGGGWLNSMEVLGMLLASWHITGKDKYYDEYNRLAIDERYGEMVPVKEGTVTVTSHRLANHSDHELASLAYYTLLRYEPNEDRRKIWIQSLRDFYKYEYEERNPLEIAVMTSAIPDADVDRAALTLLEMPMDWRTCRYDNEHRKDNTVSKQTDRHDDPQFEHIFPYDEFRTIKWNANPYEIHAGSTCKQEQAPWPFLLPYWMMRYGQAIQ